ncbi:MAG: IS256 family transposase [Ethanoligenens sp.]
MLEWLCDRLMEAEISAKIGADKSEHSAERNSYHSGYRPRRFDTRMGTIYLMVPKVRQGGYVPFFVSNRKRNEAALIQVVQQAFVNGVSTRKMEHLAKSLGIENLSRSQVSNMAKELDGQVESFRNRPLNSSRYPVLWVDALYEKVRYDGHVISMAIQVVCGVNEEGIREVLAIEPMLEESKESYTQLFDKLKERGLQTPSLVISDAHSGLIAAIQKNFPGASWQRCKVHFMRNILARIPHKSKENFAADLKQIWLAPDAKAARKRADSLTKEYEQRFPDTIRILEDGLEDSLQFYAFSALDSRKIASSNMLERLNKEIRRRTRVVGIFPNPDSYVRLVATYLMEYAEDWSDARAYFSAESIREAFSTAA